MSEWKKLGEQKRDSVNALIPKPWLLPTPLPSAGEQRDVTGKYIRQFLSEKEVEITETDAVGIVGNTTSGAWKARDVVMAFCHRAAIAHQMVNCLHEIFFDAALEEAQKLDNYYAKHQKPIGPLHGLPVSLKDQFHVKGVETTMGYIGWIGTFQGIKGSVKEKVFESEMVRELRNLGAILYVKTSVPHTLMSGETINNIIGYTSNPKNRLLSSGGSSGGEGALMSLRGSPAGFGTDIGGSIRIPAGFNGLFGIRPSVGRMPYEGLANSMDGQNTVLPVVGPFTPTVSALKLLWKSILSQEPWLHDPMVLELPWRSEQEQAVFDMAKPGGSRQLAFGILRHDQVVAPHPPIIRALDLVVKTLKKLGHKVIEWKPPSHSISSEIWLNALLYDGGVDVRNAFRLSGETMAPAIHQRYGNDLTDEFTGSRIAFNNVAKREYQKEYMDYWNSTAALTETGRPVDAFLSPIAPYAVPRPGMYDYYGYTTVVNVLDYTAGTIPVTTVDKNIDVVPKGFKPLNELDEKVFKSYDPEIYDGAYVGVQLVGRRLQEEKVIALMEYIAGVLEK